MGYTAATFALLVNFLGSSENDSRITHCGHKNTEFGDNKNDQTYNHTPSFPWMIEIHRAKRTTKQDEWDKKSHRHELPIRSHNCYKWKVVMFQFVSPEEITIAKSTTFNSFRIVQVPVFGYEKCWFTGFGLYSSIDSFQLTVEGISGYSTSNKKMTWYNYMGRESVQQFSYQSVE